MNFPQFVNAMKSSQNPMQFFAQTARSVPQVAQVMKMMQGKTPAEFKSIVENMARERGTTLEQVITDMGFTVNK